MAEPLIGIEYGGASAAIVHQDRLVLAGCGVIPDFIMASRTGDKRDFRLGTWRWDAGDGSDSQTAVALDPLDRTQSDAAVPANADFVAGDADGFYASQLSGRGARYHALLQQEGLFVFGDTAESVVPPNRFTARTVEVRENSWFGSDTGRTPIIAGGLVVFVQKDGEDIRGIAWTEAERKYLAQSLVTHATGVFSRIVDMTFTPSAGRDGDTVYAVDEDGTMAVMLLQVGNALPAWAVWRTPGGSIVGAAAPLGHLVMLVEREGVVALETLDEETPAEDLKDGEVRWEAAVETLPYVVQKNTGLQRNVRRMRFLDVNLDVTTTGPARQQDDEFVSKAQQIRLTQILESGRNVRERTRRPPRVVTPSRPRQDTDDILRLRYGNTSGWRDRLALRFEAPVRVQIAGLSYRPIA